MFGKHQSLWVAIGILSLSSLIIGVLIGSNLITATETGAETPLRFQEFSDAFAEIAMQVNPAVVNISCTEEESAGRDDEMRETRPPDDKRYGFGSGVIIDREGYILTSNHVIESASRIDVKLSDNRQFVAKLVGQDKETDLALIKVTTDKPLPAAPLGNSDSLRPGQWVMAIGNPFVYDHTVTVGVISALNRKLGTTIYDSFIQTDAAINFGNSGGPLLNIKGEVIGINTLISSQGTGIGFSIPVNLAKQIIAELRSKGHVTRGFLGLVPQDLTPELRKSLGIDVSHGVLVSSVQKDTPADRCGVKRYDVILEVDGKMVESEDEFRRHIADTLPGKNIRLKIWREKQLLIIESKLSEREPDRRAQLKPHNKTDQRLGLELEDDTLSGVRVRNVAAGTAAEAAGLNIGDLILEVNRKPVTDASTLTRQLQQASRDTLFLFYVERGDEPIFLTLAPPSAN